MRDFLKRIWSWWRKSPAPAAPPEKKVIPCEFRVIVLDGQPICESCGEKLPLLIADPELIQVFFYGMVAAVHDYGIGANPYWSGKHCYAVAAWNAGWDHANECGNKKGTSHGRQESRSG